MSLTHANRTTGLMHTKQLDYSIEANFLLRNFVVTASTSGINITPQINAWAATGGRNSSSVPSSVSTNIDEVGVVIGNRAGRIQINDSLNNVRLEDADQKEIYGQLNNVSGQYSLTFAKSDGAGGNTSVSVPPGTYDFLLVYNYRLYQLPSFGLRSHGRTIADQDPTTAAVIGNELVYPTGNFTADFFNDSGTGTLGKIYSIDPDANITFPPLSTASLTGGRYRIRFNADWSARAAINPPPTYTTSGTETLIVPDGWPSDGFEFVDIIANPANNRWELAASVQSSGGTTISYEDTTNGQTLEWGKHYIFHPTFNYQFSPVTVTGGNEWVKAIPSNQNWQAFTGS